MFRVFIGLSLGAIIFGIPRGFDFSDEGLYVLLADPNQQNIGGIFNYDLFFKLIHRFTGLEFGIIGLRIIRLIIYFAGAFGLAVFWKNLFESQTLPLSIFLLGLAGLFAGYGFLPPALSYNSIAVVAVCFWLAIISRKNMNPSGWILLGIVFAILFYAKVTTCLLLGALTVIYFLLKNKLNWQQLILLCLPFLILESLFYVLFKENALTRLTGEFGFLQQRQDYTFMNLVKYTAVGGFWILLGGGLFFISARLKKSGVRSYFWLLDLGMLLIIIVFYLTFITSEWSHGILLITFAFICWQLGSIDLSGFKRNELLFMLILMLLPFLLHFGSNVYWMRLGIHYWVFWLLAFAILIQSRTTNFQIRFYVIASFSSLVVVLFGIWFRPFEGTALWNATHPWEYHGGKRIWLNEAEITFLDEIKSEVSNPKATNVVALFGNPGLLYLTGANSPYSPGYWKSAQAEMFLKDGAELDLIFFNQQEVFPFDRNNWTLTKELIQPNGEKLLILWKK